MINIDTTVNNIQSQHRSSAEVKLKQYNNKFSNSVKTIIESDNKASKRPVDKKLKNVCEEMESLFVARMFKAMRKTLNKTDMLHGGFAQDVFEDMLYDKYALQVSQNSNLGLAKLLYNEMSAMSSNSHSQKNLKA
jgi:flagellar protein FlgJ